MATLPTKTKFDREIIIDDFSLVIPIENDAEELSNLIKNNFNYIAENSNRSYRASTLEDAKNYIKGINEAYDELKAFHYLIKKDNKLVGMIEMINVVWSHGSTEFGYFLGEKFTGNGYVTRAIKKLEEMFFGVGFEKIVIRTAVDNNKSISISEKNCYKKEGTLKKHYFNNLKQDYVDYIMFSKLRSEYLK